MKKLYQIVKEIMFYKKASIILLFIFSTSCLFSQTKEQIDELRTIVTLLDYVSKDYPMAVHNGKIINDAEYIEQIDFVEKSISLHKELTPVFNNEEFTNIGKTIEDLLVSIHNLEETSKVSTLALSTKNQFLDLGILKISPTKWPSLKNGRVLYAQNCASCHGLKGQGDGKQGLSLDPPPSNFQDSDAMNLLSPLQAYNVIKLGVEGTGMASYDPVFSENEIWDLGFYVLSIRHDSTDKIKELPKGIELESVAKWTDNELRSYLEENKSNITIEAVRNFEPTRQKPLDIAQKELDLSYLYYKNGEYKLAEKHALTSYLEGIELVENLISAVDSKLTASIESNMVNYRKSIQKKDDASVEIYYEKLTEEINTARSLLSNIDYSFAFIYGASLSILLREALEALIIILIMFSILKPLNIKKAMTAVHIGWMSAVALGLVCWIFVDHLVNLSGASRELMEGIGSIIAVLVLLYAGTWLHSHSEAEKWTHFIKTKIGNIKESGNWIGLSVFSFIVVFREAIEVVLFLSSLKLNNPETAGPALNWAIVTAVIIIAIITYLFLKTTKKLPIGKIFKISAYIVALLSIVLTGKGISALQEAGYINVTELSFIPRVEILGIYPTIQTIGSQILVLFTLIFFTRRNKNKT